MPGASWPFAYTAPLAVAANNVAPLAKPTMVGEPGGHDAFDALMHDALA
jgi:hypothetical protein